jgi:hypothetical protein
MAAQNQQSQLRIVYSDPNEEPLNGRPPRTSTSRRTAVLTPPRPQLNNMTPHMKLSGAGIGPELN